MEHTEEQKTEFKEQFGKRHRKQLMVTIPLILAMFILILGGNEDTGLVFGLIPNGSYFTFFSIFIIFALIFSLKNWRCPACNKYLGKNYNPKFCPSCGAELR
jgi:hypothetical protein